MDVKHNTASMDSAPIQIDNNAMPRPLSPLTRI